MIVEVCAAIVILLCLAVIAFLLFYYGNPLSIEKRKDGGKMTVKIKARRDVEKVVLKASSLELVRSGLKGGDEVEFSFPVSAKGATLTVFIGDKPREHKL